MKSLNQIKQEQKDNPGFIDGYEKALTEIVNHFTSINIVNQPIKIFKSTQLEDIFRNLLK